MKNALNLILASVAVSLALIAGSTGYSAYVSSSSHTKSCARTDLILDSFHDVIVLALTPQPGQTLTAKQVITIQTFEQAAFARLDRARC